MATKQPMTELLREQIRGKEKAGVSISRLAARADIAPSALLRFMNGGDLKLSTVEKLAEYCGLELREKS